MSQEVLKRFGNKEFYMNLTPDFRTFTQVLDGSKAAYCPAEDQSYWLYFSDNDMGGEPIAAIAMSESETSELEYHDIISDVADASNRGMYAEVTDFVKQLLIERSVRREVVFALNTYRPGWIQSEKGIVYRISREAIELLSPEVDAKDAAVMAMQRYVE